MPRFMGQTWPPPVQRNSLRSKVKGARHSGHAAISRKGSHLGSIEAPWRGGIYQPRAVTGRDGDGRVELRVLRGTASRASVGGRAVPPFGLEDRHEESIDALTAEKKAVAEHTLDRESEARVDGDRGRIPGMDDEPDPVELE